MRPLRRLLQGGVGTLIGFIDCGCLGAQLFSRGRATTLPARRFVVVMDVVLHSV